jgi:hypothetical protein
VPVSSSRRLDIALAMLLILAAVSLMLPPLLPVAWIANTVLVACAAAKARLVVLDFLGLRASTPLWRGIVGAWVWLVVSTTFLGAAVTPLLH